MCIHMMCAVQQAYAVGKVGWPKTLMTCPWWESSLIIFHRARFNLSVILQFERPPDVCPRPVCMWWDSQASLVLPQQLMLYHPVTCFHQCLDVCVCLSVWGRETDRVEVYESARQLTGGENDDDDDSGCLRHCFWFAFPVKVQQLSFRWTQSSFISAAEDTATYWLTTCVYVELQWRK